MALIVLTACSNGFMTTEEETPGYRPEFELGPAIHFRRHSIASAAFVNTKGSNPP
jgi:hypothetical protein